MREFSLKMPIHAPFGGVFLGGEGVKWGNGNFLQFYPSRKAVNWDWHLMYQKILKLRKNRSCGSVLGHKKSRLIVAGVRDAATGQFNCLEFLHARIVEIITRAKY